MASNDVSSTRALLALPAPSVDSILRPGASTMVQPVSPVPPSETNAAAEAEEARSHHQVCITCRESWSTEVLLPCRHQACCKTCWPACALRECTIHNRHERLERELGARGVVRCAFRPRCPVCIGCSSGSDQPVHKAYSVGV